MNPNVPVQQDRIATAASLISWLNAPSSGALNMVVLTNASQADFMAALTASPASSSSSASPSTSTSGAATAAVGAGVTFSAASLQTLANSLSSKETVVIYMQNPVPAGAGNIYYTSFNGGQTLSAPQVIQNSTMTDPTNSLSLFSAYNKLIKSNPLSLFNRGCMLWTSVNVITMGPASPLNWICATTLAPWQQYLILGIILFVVLAILFSVLGYMHYKKKFNSLYDYVSQQASAAAASSASSS